MPMPPWWRKPGEPCPISSFPLPTLPCAMAGVRCPSPPALINTRGGRDKIGGDDLGWGRLFFKPKYREILERGDGQKNRRGEWGKVFGGGTNELRI
jgi:hypothetical protein